MLAAPNDGRTSEAVSYFYDLMGNLTQMVDNGGKTTYTYNQRGLLTSETRGGTEKSYAYDANGNRTQFTMGDVNVSYSYDGLNRLASLTDGGVTTEYTYDANGNILSETTDGGRSVTYRYNKINALVGKTNYKDGNVLTQYGIDYYADGNIKSVEENGVRTQFTYDLAGRLVGEKTPEGQMAYAYDARGNRTQSEVYNKSGVMTAQSLYSYDKNNRLLDIVTAYLDGTQQRTDYRYDANGNRTMRAESGTSWNRSYTRLGINAANGSGVTQYSYDALGRMTQVQSGNQTASYTYDGSGLRQSKTVDGVTTVFSYDGANIIKEGNTYYSRGAAGLIASKSGSTTEYYYTDYHGSVVQHGNVTYSYDAFGNETSETADNNPFRYCGEYFDYESGLLYLRARYYDAGVGSFTQEDPAKDGLNWYVYCGGNPVMFVDPWGLDPNLGRAIDDYFAGKMTVTIAIRRPVANSRVVATVDGGKIDNGHTFLRLDDGNGHVRYIGFNPNGNNIVKMVTSEDVDGKITDDKYEPWNVAKTFEINADQYNAIIAYANDVKNDGTKYNIETFNCTTFAVYALNKAGISFGQTNISRKQWTLPANLKEELDEYKLKGILPMGMATDYVRKQMGDNVGYTPADAAQDLKYSRGVVFLYYYGMNDNYKGYVTIQN